MTRRRLTIGFLLPTVEVRDRVRVVLSVAQSIAEAGDLVFVIVPGAASISDWPFVSGQELAFAPIEPEHARGVLFDVLFTTWWDTLDELSGYRAATHALLASGLEDRVDEARRISVGEPPTVLPPALRVVCTSHRVRDELVSTYRVEPKRLSVIPLPFDVAGFAGPRAAVRKGGRPRFLVQGRERDPGRNVPRTLALLEAAGVEYLWVGAQVNRRLAGPGCRRILENVPYRDMPGVYASADVLVFLSDAPGASTSPLEMFATGGTAIVWDAPGMDDVVVHRHDGWICPRHSDEAVIEAIRRLDRDRATLDALQRGARATAASMPSRAEWAEAIVAAVRSLAVEETRAF